MLFNGDNYWTFFIVFPFSFKMKFQHLGQLPSSGLTKPNIDILLALLCGRKIHPRIHEFHPEEDVSHFT